MPSKVRHREDKRNGDRSMEGGTGKERDRETPRDSKTYKSPMGTKTPLQQFPVRDSAGES